MKNVNDIEAFYKRVYSINPEYTIWYYKTYAHLYCRVDNAPVSDHIIDENGDIKKMKTGKIVGNINDISDKKIKKLFK